MSAQASDLVKILALAYGGNWPQSSKKLLNDATQFGKITIAA